ncbi:response regulator [Hyalangium sp.]|uniref:response regulator n=1 Tax=Hyalangium sp. TaxID=2028555 RepID=UPI002D2F29FB|nr:response regulator [Hyalangium sp.]HYI03152.1 response regulator [Hyalangium sp.]
MKTSGTPRRSLLLVEDDPANWLTLSAVLEDAGFAVAVAESCTQAAQLLERRTQYDVVLLDWSLGDGDGQGLIPLVRSQVPAAKIVLVSGRGPSGSRVPVDAVFQKGAQVGELLACLERLLRDAPG